MDVFLQTFGIVGGVVLAVVLGIVALSLFFTAMGRSGRHGGAATPVLTDLLIPDSLVTVHLVDGTSLGPARYVGIAAGGAGGIVPYELEGMVILRDEQSRHILVRAKVVRSMVIQSTGQDDDR